MSNFKPAKLSHSSLDTFVKKYSTDTPVSGNIPYITEDNTQIFFNPSTIFLDLKKANEFKYLLGQTKPFHSKEDYFSIQDLAWIKKEDGSDELWTTNSKLMSQFVTIGNKLSFLPLVKRP